MFIRNTSEFLLTGCVLCLTLLSANLTVFAQEDDKYVLHDAVKQKNLATVKKLIQSGADVNKQNSDGNTPLHLASTMRNPAFAATLIKAGAKVNLGNKKGQRPIHLAAYSGRKEIVKLLFQNNATRRILTNYNESALHYAARAGHVDLCKILIQAGLRPVDQRDTGNTALHEAIATKKKSATELLLTNWRLLPVKNKAGMTPLELAVNLEFDEMLWPLIVSDDKNWESMFKQAFSFAVEHNKPKSMTMFLSRGLPSSNYPGSGVYGLHRAAELGHDDVLECMLETGADSDTAMLLSKWTPLHMAVMAGHSSTVELLKKYNSNINAQTASGTTALHLAILFNNKNILEQLLKMGVDPNLADDVGKTPLHIAVSENQDKMIPILLNEGADPDLVDVYGNSPTFLAFKAKKPNVVAKLQKGYKPPLPKIELEERFAIAVMGGNREVLDNVMAKEDFNPNGALPDGSRLIHLASTVGDIELATSLLDLGADVNEQRSYPKWTPLHYAVNGNYFELVEILLNRGADPNLADVLGITPLHVAGQIKDDAIWEAVLNAGGDPLIPDVNEVTPEALRAFSD